MPNTAGPGPSKEVEMDNTSSKEGAKTRPSAAPQEAPALIIPGAITYNELMREIDARNPIIASRRP